MDYEADEFPRSIRSSDEKVIVNNYGGMQHEIKLDWTLLPVSGLEQVARVMHQHCDEYGGPYPRANWTNIDAQDHLRHLVSHAMQALLTWEETYDGDFSQTTEEVTHACCRCLMFLHTIQDYCK